MYKYNKNVTIPNNFKKHIHLLNHTLSFALSITSNLNSPPIAVPRIHCAHQKSKAWITVVKNMTNICRYGHKIYVKQHI